MIKLENVEVVGFEAAIREMRNLRHSSPESDSVKCYANANCLGICKNNVSGICIRPNDLDLMTRLCHDDTHRSGLMRTITIYVDVTAPLYWWREFDTYKVGTVADSCVSDKKFTLVDSNRKRLWSGHMIGSYNQKRTVISNYEILTNIYKSRNKHKFNEWDEFCKWIEGLPYSEFIIGNY